MPLVETLVEMLVLLLVETLRVPKSLSLTIPNDKLIFGRFLPFFCSRLMYNLHLTNSLSVDLSIEHHDNDNTGFPSER